MAVYVGITCENIENPGNSREIILTPGFKFTLKSSGIPVSRDLGLEALGLIKGPYQTSEFDRVLSCTKELRGASIGTP